MSAHTPAPEHAFPVSTIDGFTQHGLTKRELFAAMAMQGLLATDLDKVAQRHSTASCAVGFADALLAALNAEEPSNG